MILTFLHKRLTIPLRSLDGSSKSHTIRKRYSTHNNIVKNHKNENCGGCNTALILPKGEG